MNRRGFLEAPVTKKPIRSYGKAIPRCERVAKQCGRPGCVNPRGKGHSKNRHPQGGACREPGCICTAFVERPCQRPTKDGRPCRFHGGSNKTGPESPSFKHGRYTGAAMRLESLAARLEHVRIDPDLLSLRADIAIIDHMIEQELIASSVSSASLHEIQAQLQLERQDPKGQSGNTDLLLHKAEVAVAARDRLFERLEARRRFVTSEHAMMVKSRDTISVAQALSLVAGLTALVRAYVTDPETRAKFLAGIAELAGVGVLQSEQSAPAGARDITGVVKRIG